MHPEISQFQSSRFYDGKVKNGPNVTGPEYTTYFNKVPYCFIDVPFGVEENGAKRLEGTDFGSSWGNAAEIKVIKSLLAVLKIGASRG